MNYIHKETGHIVKMLEPNVINKDGKKTVVIQQPGNRVVSRLKKKFKQDYEPEQTKVFIHLTTGGSKDTYAVVLLTHQDYWLDSFSTKEQAEDYIKLNNFKSVKFIDTRTGG